MRKILIMDNQVSIRMILESNDFIIFIAPNREDGIISEKIKKALT